MVGKLGVVNRDLFVRRCVACGYDGALLKRGRADRCARCGCDLRRRPARSYAEMEGIVGPQTQGGKPPAADLAIKRQRDGILHRWLAFLFVVVVGLIVLITLVAAALP